MRAQTGTLTYAQATTQQLLCRINNTQSHLPPNDYSFTTYLQQQNTYLQQQNTKLQQTIERQASIDELIQEIRQLREEMRQDTKPKK